MSATVATPPTYHSLHPPEATAAVTLNDGDHLPDYGTLVATGTVRSPGSRSNPIQETLPPKEFEYKMPGKSEVVLKIMAPAALSKDRPGLTGQGPATGEVQLNLDKPETIQTVSISITGSYLTGTADEHVKFLEIVHPIWVPGQATMGNAVRSDGKLRGTYSWPFSVDLPSEVTIPAIEKNSTATCLLPHSFAERGIYGGVSYTISVKVKRGRLRPDYKITAPFGYVPVVRPPPFPPLRLLSYQEQVPLLTPDIDPEGWHAVGPISMEGVLFKTFPVHATCELFLAKPLSYTRGTVIPLYMRLTSFSQQLVDLLRDPKAISASLYRQIFFEVPPRLLHNPENVHNTRGRDTLNGPRAIWWDPGQSSDVSNGSSTLPTGEHVRHVQGEIHLESNLKPSSDLPYFRIQYSVLLLPFKAVGFEIKTETLPREQRVEIVTAFASGPRPVRSAPPGYDLDVTPRAAGEAASTAFFTGSAAFM